MVVILNFENVVGDPLCGQYGMYHHKAARGYAPLWSHFSCRQAQFQSWHPKGGICAQRFHGIDLFLVNDDGTVTPAPKAPEAPVLPDEPLFTPTAWDEDGYPYMWSPVTESTPRNTTFTRDTTGRYQLVPQQERLFYGDDDDMWRRLCCRVTDVQRVSGILMDVEMCLDWP